MSAPLPSGKFCECGLPHEAGGPCWECRADLTPAPDIGALVADVVNAYRETVQVQMAWEKRNRADALCDMGAVSLSRQCEDASDKLQSALAALAALKGGAA